MARSVVQERPVRVNDSVLRGTARKRSPPILLFNQIALHLNRLRALGGKDAAREWRQGLLTAEHTCRQSEDETLGMPLPPPILCDYCL